MHIYSHTRLQGPRKRQIAGRSGKEGDASKYAKRVTKLEQRAPASPKILGRFKRNGSRLSRRSGSPLMEDPTPTFLKKKRLSRS